MKEKILAAVIRLIDKGKVRVGNQKYTEEHGSRGATTLASEHVEVDGFKISLDFPGKSGKQREIEFSDNKTAEVISQCEEIEGQYLFCYHDDEGAVRDVAWASGLANWFLAVPELQARGRVPLVDGRTQAVRDLAREGQVRLRRNRPKRAARAALLATWRASRVLKRAERCPDLVGQGGLGQSEFARRLSLIWHSVGGYGLVWR